MQEQDSVRLFAEDFAVCGPNDATQLHAEAQLTGVGALHGGAIAAFALLAARRGCCDDASAIPSAASFHINFLRAGRGALFNAHTTSARQVKELGFFDLSIRDADDQVIASAHTALSARRTDLRSADPWTTPPGDGAEYAAAGCALPFLRDRGLSVPGVAVGRLEMAFEPVARNLDSDGAMHEAAMLALIDAAGSTIPYTVRRPKSHGATLSLSAHFTGHRPASSVFARARIRDHSAQYFWSEIDLVDARETHCGSATLLYRFADGA
ncbi:PaaI family thioesterase [Bradyrhizobium sp. U87765 SZCCT0131]|uniref:PaaI family thioesterase n=1 Tax=unclassified Bradyrhizobium TaxID=2631580 RepID=UPI001BA67E7C|nr:MULTISPECIES: PaaI family thioesterase [unclassified Bradyrhizobium]MBR1221325.1 PaaI family thioesterase [Bradyrhizobium sp. U87765 SZCCT0131]MBR1264752.1 PaaI family thioesterase [Bradyrhizobium sp. U87765 SZCCT0134]MBR1304342.1 PaaI family thioesterase [Bradyrhizobium sp. U87765 SZCCT0110]MBR1322801.1 PaaI family thioesterase [Bradyrhizobium sp. U87765 SZCCT0109]MBR1346271.1 PaaI family thioesterase [Bradyrhizobium sp. U87765 SZCCT0048]